MNANAINRYINKELKGKVIFLNFDKGNGKNDQKPFEEKFIAKIQVLVEDIIRNKSNFKENPFACLLDFYQRNSSIIDELIESDCCLLDFFEFIEQKVNKAKELSTIKRELITCLHKLNLEQLIFILVLLYISCNICAKTEKKLFFLLDNMDIVYKNNVLDQSMNEYSNFIEDMNSLVQEIDINRGNNRVWVQYYEQANFIFAMRETTTMQIADQFLDRLEFVAKYFDISMYKIHFLQKI